MDKKYIRSEADMQANRHKPLPYSANQKIDEVLMNNAELNRILAAMAEQLESAVALKQLVKMMSLVHSSSEALKEIKIAGK